MEEANFVSPWWWTQGFPFLLNLLCWALLAGAIITMWRLRNATAESEKNRKINPRTQDQVYKRFAFVLIAIGALGGFGPSLAMFLINRKPWSVNRQIPHLDADATLYVHIFLAFPAIALIVYQFWTGGVGKKRNQHRKTGWLAVTFAFVGIAVAGGWVWTYINDFSDGLTSPRARAGYYTVILGIGVAVNMIMLVVRAKQKDFLRHKDHAMMALFWILEPGVHRFCMWLMRWFGGPVWAPENTEGMGIAFAKLPANIFVILWAITMAVKVGRLNRIILSNVAGQFILFLAGCSAAMPSATGTAGNINLLLITITLGVVALVTAKKSGTLQPAR